MGRYILCGKIADSPFEVEELDLRIYTIEELCFYIYHNLSLIDDEFIDEKLITFIRKELEMPEIAQKIERFYSSPSDQDSTLQMLLSEVGYYTDQELTEFQSRLVKRRRRNGPERVREKADSLREKKRYYNAIRTYRILTNAPRDGRVGQNFYPEVMEAMANCYGRLCEFQRASEILGKLYEETGSERILKKLHDVSVLSGVEPPEKYFSRLPGSVVAAWKQDYWKRESAAKSSLEENRELQIFLKDPAVAREELKQYAEQKKEEFRAMLE